MIESIALYLPQFHPVKENDEWWGKGFTEWTNVAKAKPLFKSHKQPILAGELGYYDLRVAETRQQQAELAKEYGISAFCYWHYWFGEGRQILERPINEVVQSQQPDFPFCLGWANESWSGIWHGSPKTVLMEQRFPGTEDYIAHFKHILPILSDKRYYRFNDKLVFLVYRPNYLPNAFEFTSLWQQLAKDACLPPFYFLGVGVEWEFEKSGFDMFVRNSPSVNLIPRSFIKKVTDKLKRDYNLQNLLGPNLYSYPQYVEHIHNSLDANEIPVVLPNWDNTPRSGRRGSVLSGSSPELFGKHVRKAVEQLKNRKPNERLLVIKSWNEWAEGNYMEPDRKHERKYLEAYKQAIQKG